MTIGERIKKRRKELNLSVDKLADILNKNRATIYRYESDEIENLPLSILEPLAKALHTTPEYLMGWDKNSDTTLPNIYPITGRKTIPVLGTIAAGQPIVAEERVEYLIANEFDIDANFALKIKGDSMINARINDGDIVFIRQQPDVEDGEIAAVLIDGEATLKRAYKMPGRVQLRAENPKYPPKDFTDKDCDDFKILGKAVGFQSKL